MTPLEPGSSNLSAYPPNDLPADLARKLGLELLEYAALLDARHAGDEGIAAGEPMTVDARFAGGHMSIGVVDRGVEEMVFVQLKAPGYEVDRFAHEALALAEALVVASANAERDTAAMPEVA